MSGMWACLSNSAARSSRDTLGLGGLGSVRSRIMDQKKRFTVESGCPVDILLCV